MTNRIDIVNDPVLTEVYRGYVPQDQDYVREKFLPKIPVRSSKGDIKEAGTAFLRIGTNLKMEGKAKTPTISIDITKANGWNTEERGLQIPITKKDGQNYDNTDWRNGQNLAASEFTRMLKIYFLVAKDLGLQQIIQNSAIITQNITLSGSSQFNDYNNSDPIGVFQDSRKAIYDSIGREANTAVMSRNVFAKLTRHPELKRSHGVTPDGTVPTRALNEIELAEAMEIDKIIVGRVKHELAREGLPSALSSVWGDHITFAYVNPNPQPLLIEKSIGYTFELDPPIIDFRDADDPKHCKFVRNVEEYDDVILDAEAAFLIINAVE